jgi:PST family polysaccharide transporter
MLVGLPLIYFYGSVGIAVSIFLAAAWPAALLWISARKNCTQGSDLVADKGDIMTLVSLGGALMLVGLVSQLSTYLVRMEIIRMEGLDAAGYYHAAFAISGSLPGFVFAAMGADFFPRVAAADGEEKALRTTEKQIMVGLILATPLIGILLLFGDEIIALLFAESFFPANEPLVWLTWGIFVRLIAWPLGYWMIARSSPKTVVAIECGAALSLVLSQSWLTSVAGLTGAGAGFFLGYVLYAIVLGIFARYKSGRWLSKRCALFVMATTTILAGGQLALHDSETFFAKAVLIAVLALWSVASYSMMKKHED